MVIRQLLRSVFTHSLALIIGFAAGVYLLPILIAPEGPSSSEVSEVAAMAEFTTQFTRELEGSDTLHWGEGEVFIGPKSISHKGNLAPGPDYKVYLSPEFVETEASFNELKSKMVRVGDVKTFDGFIVSVPDGVDTTKFNTIVVWCESFGEFITAAKYQ